MISYNNVFETMTDTHSKSFVNLFVAMLVKKSIMLLSTLLSLVVNASS